MSEAGSCIPRLFEQIHPPPIRIGDPLDGLFAANVLAAVFDERIPERGAADREPGGPRAFVKATFDAGDGHIVHYVHSVMKTRERLEVTVTLRPVTASSP